MCDVIDKVAKCLKSMQQDSCLRFPVSGSVLYLTTVWRESQPITGFCLTKHSDDTHTAILMFAAGALDWFIVKDPSHGDKTIFEVNWNRLHCIILLCIALRQDWIESYQTDCLKYIIGALNYCPYIEVHIESVTEGEIHSLRREFCGPESPVSVDENENVSSCTLL